MKKILLILGIALSTSFFVACETEEKVVDFVFENTQNGAILRQVSVTGLLDLFDVNSGVSVVLEYQDAEGSLASNIQSVDEVYHLLIKMVMEIRKQIFHLAKSQDGMLTGLHLDFQELLSIINYLELSPRRD